MLNLKIFLIALLFCPNYGYSSASSKVPLLLWSNIRDLSCKKPTHYQEDNVASVFTDEYMHCLTTAAPDEVIIFVYNQLGIEDITLYGQKNQFERNAFSNINTYMSNHGILTVTAMESSQIVEDLFKKFDSARDGFAIKIVQLPSADRLNPNTTFDGLQSIDDEIGRTMSTTNGRYIAIVTSESSPRLVGEIRYERDVGRQLLSINDEAPIVKDWYYLIGDCIMMSFESVNLTVTPQNQKSYSRKLIVNNSNTTDFEDEICLPANTTIGNINVTINFVPLLDNSTNVQFRMIFNKNFSAITGYDWWKLSQMSVTINEATIELIPYLFENIITAPSDLSYACANTTGLTYLDASGKKDLNDTVYVQFNGFQVQPFIHNQTFRYNRAVDCSGWYTGPIMSGLIVTVLLLLILFFVINIMASVTTMDRFDDPKGKTMTVPQESS